MSLAGVWSQAVDFVLVREDIFTFNFPDKDIL
jgi:hypothetical protein